MVDGAGFINIHLVDMGVVWDRLMLLLAFTQFGTPSEND